MGIFSSYRSGVWQSSAAMPFVALHCQFSQVSIRREELDRKKNDKKNWR
ncbi:MAG: hypothetical protein ACLR2O_00390 [Coprococcus sp.]